MADPITIIGTAGAIANIIDVVGKTIQSLRDLHDRWRDADFTLLSLIAQLTALKAALGKIQEWVDSDLAEEQHHQLAMDLDLSMTCCRMLVGRMDEQVSEIRRKTSEGEPLDLGSKIRIMFGSKANEDLQKVMERQVSALTLLLTACNCKSNSEQKVILEKSSSRKIFRRVQDDSASLYVHRDTDSFYSRCTDNLSKISTVFQFDREVFISKVYERALRGSLKESLRRRQADVKATTQSPLINGMTWSELRKQDQRSEEINNTLWRERHMLGNEINMLLLSGPDSGKEALMAHMELFHNGGYSRDERECYRDQALSAALKAVQVVMEGLEVAGVQLNDEDRILAGILSQEIEKSEVDKAEITPATANATESLIKSLRMYPQLDSLFREVIDKVSDYTLNSAGYWLKHIQRISHPYYIPTDIDILHLRSRGTQGMKEYVFVIGDLTYRIVDSGAQWSTHPKWAHQFERVTCVLFVVDISSYDQPSVSEPGHYQLTETLMLFESVVNSRWFGRSPIVLFLTNVTRFKEKLGARPLRDYFPHYTGENYFHEATEYIISRFTENAEGLGVKLGRTLYTTTTDASDASNMRFLVSAVNDFVVEKSLRESGLV